MTYSMSIEYRSIEILLNPFGHSYDKSVSGISLNVGSLVGIRGSMLKEETELKQNSFF